MFPAGEVSRMRPNGVRDSAWSPGFARLATKTGAPVLPVHIAAQNSPLFLRRVDAAKPLASLLLAREMFGASKARIGFNVGELVPCKALAESELAPAGVAAHMRRHVYRLARRRPTVFPTSSAIAHPESPLAVRSALRRAERLGETHDRKQILLLDSVQDCPAMRELGRLRELAFRRVGEGTGARRDLDRFDAHYRHLVLWTRTRSRSSARTGSARRARFSRSAAPKVSIHRRCSTTRIRRRVPARSGRARAQLHPAGVLEFAQPRCALAGHRARIFASDPMCAICSDRESDRRVAESRARMDRALSTVTILAIRTRSRACAQSVRHLARGGSRRRRRVGGSITRRRVPRGFVTDSTHSMRSCRRFIASTSIFANPRACVFSTSGLIRRSAAASMDSFGSTTSIFAQRSVPVISSHGGGGLSRTSRKKPFPARVVAKASPGAVKVKLRNVGAGGSRRAWGTPQGAFVLRRPAGVFVQTKPRPAARFCVRILMESWGMKNQLRLRLLPWWSSARFSRCRLRTRRTPPPR